MKSLMKKIDLFCYRHPRFGVSNLMLYIVIGNVIVWLFSWFAPEILNYLYFSPYHILHGQVWRLVTFIIYPISTDFLAIISFYFYYWIGRTLENQWGPGKFTFFLLSGVVLTIVYCFLVYAVVALRLPAQLELPRDYALLQGMGRVFPADFSSLAGLGITGAAAQNLREQVLMMASLPATASYIYFSLFMAFATLFPETRVYLFFIIPVKMKWLAIVDAAFFAYGVVTNIAAGAVLYGMLPLVALLNYLIFCGGWLFDWLRPARRQVRKNTMNFKQEVRRIQYEQQTKPYSRRCEVCGRTDADFPDLEFRYCSRCQGYHCFCIDHINNHQHFTE